MDQKKQFSSKLGFIATAAGSAIGLYNIWQFPYQVGAHGGACFLLIYIGCVFIIGFPLVVAELALGRHVRREASVAYAKVGGGKAWGILGHAAIITGALILSYYIVVTGWILGYAVETCRGSLSGTSEFASFFECFIQDISSNLIYTALVIFSTGAIIQQGIQSGLEKWSKILMPAFLITLLGLILYAFTLEGAWEGVRFYLVPDWGKVTAKTVYAALAQSFVSLSVGLSILATYGAYLRKKDDIIASAVIITLSDTAVAFLAGLMLFPFIFHQKLAPSQGMQLVFVSLPQVFRSLGPWLGRFVGTTFFLLFLLAAITSVLSIIEMLVKHLQEYYQISRKKATFAVVVLAYIGSMPTIFSMDSTRFLGDLFIFKGKHWSFFELIALLVEDILLNIICFLFSLMVAYRWGTQNLLKEVRSSDKKYPLVLMYVNLMIRYVCPIILGGICIMKIKNILG